MQKLKNIWARMLRQHSWGKKVGGIKDVALHTAAWLSMVNFALIAMTAYHTTLREFILQYIPWLTLTIFMLFMFVLVVVAMIVEYKFIIPSTWAFRNLQQYEHQYPIKKDLEKLSKKLDKIEKIIKTQGKNNAS